MPATVQQSLLSIRVRLSASRRRLAACAIEAGPDRRCKPSLVSRHVSFIETHPERMQRKWTRAFSSILPSALQRRPL